MREERRRSFGVPLGVVGLVVALLALVPWLGREAPAPRSQPHARSAAPEVPPAPLERRAAPPDGSGSQAAAVAGVLERILEGAGGAPAPASSREALALARDPRAPLPRRLAAVRRLGERPGDESFSALQQVLADNTAPSLLRGAAAEALGSATHPDAAARLRELLEAEDPDVATGAIRAVAARGSDDALELLAAVLREPAHAGAVRAEAAHALGRLDDPRATPLLVELLAASPDEAWAAALLGGLAAQPISRSEPFLRAYLESSEVPLDLRIAAVRALEQGGAAVVPLLLETTREARAPELRAAAVAAVAATADPAALGALLAAAREEPHPAVRADLYAALATAPELARERADAYALVGAVTADPSPQARVEGSRLLARVLAADRDPGLERAFDEALVPWLESQAAAGAPGADPLVAVEALGSAGTERALGALHRLARSQDPAVSSAAERAIARARSARRGSP